MSLDMQRLWRGQGAVPYRSKPVPLGDVAGSENNEGNNGSPASPLVSQSPAFYIEAVAAHRACPHDFARLKAFSHGKRNVGIQCLGGHAAGE
jgi:hypothetical protein